MNTEKGKVLLVDDNLDMLLIGQRIFSRVGYKFISARTGQEGLEKAKTEKPDVIVLDYILPDLSGTQFIKEIATNKEFEANKFIPVIMLTARTNYIEDLDNCFGLGLKAYLNKPFGHRELVNVVDNIVRIDRVQKKSANAHAPEKNKPAKNFEEETIDVQWMEDAKIAAGTISTLCKELNSDENKNLSIQQKMELEAIYRSSSKLLQMINKKASRINGIKSRSVLF